MSRIGKAPIPLPGGVTVTLKGLEVTIKGPKGELSRTLPEGVSIAQEGDALVVSAGYSHPVEMVPPEGVTFAVENNTTVIVSGADKELVGNEAAKVRAIRPPEPYKGKGIKYEGERILRKVGKTGKK